MGKLITFKAFSKILKRRGIYTYNDLLKDRKTKVLNFFAENISIEEIAKKLSIPEISVQNILYSEGVLDVKRPKLSKDLQAKAAAFYKDGRSMRSIAEEFNVSEKLISRAIFRCGGKRREHCENHYVHKNLNNDFFKSIDSKYKAWILGFIFADGSISSLELSISQDTEYAYILSLIAKAIGHNGNLTDASKSHTENRQKILSISRKYIVEDLKKLGLLTYKEDDLSFPFDFIKPEFYLAFIAGFFFGDGCIAIRYYRKDAKYPLTHGLLQFTATQKMCLDIKNILIKHLPDVLLLICKEGEKNAYRLSATNNNFSMNIAELLQHEGFGIFHIKKNNRFFYITESLRRTRAMGFLSLNPDHKANLLADAINKKVATSAEMGIGVEQLAKQVPYNRGSFRQTRKKEKFVNVTTLEKLESWLNLEITDLIDFDLLELEGIIPANKWSLLTQEIVKKQIAELPTI